MAGSTAQTMIRETFCVGALQCNCTILGDANSLEAVVIDPGDECSLILQKLAEHQLKVKAIIHTHAHIDHIGATWELAQATGATTYLHADDQFLHSILPQQAMMLGVATPTSGPLDAQLIDDGVIAFGAHEIGVLHTPGHTPGSVCFHMNDLCFSGDTLFQNSIGRTDLPGGDFDTITTSIRNRLYSLNGAVEVIPGHGPNTSIDQERRSNPFVRERT